MAGTFQEWLRWPDRTVVVLAELQPSIEILAWTEVGVSAPNTWSASVPRAIRTDVLAGGLTQRCQAVQEDETRLAPVADLAAVDATAGSWWWDEANDTLYVQPSAGEPADFTMQAFVTIYLATKGVVLDRVDGDPDTGLYYQPFLDGTLPTITREVEDLFFGQKNIATGDIQLLNGTGLWDTLLAPEGAYTWKNKEVALFVGGEYNGLVLARSAYVAVTTMLVEDASADEVYATFVLKPKARRLTAEVPRTPIFETEYPHLGDGVRGTKKWVGYGRAIMTPDLTDTSGYGVWTVADASVQTLFAIHAVWARAKSNGARTLLTLTTHYTVDLTLCTVTVVDATYAWADYDMVVDVTGKPDGAGGYLRRFGEIVVDLLLTFAGVRADEIDQSAFDQCDIDADEELSVWLKSPRSLASILSTAQEEFPSLERSVMGTVQETLAGKFTAWIWSPSYDATTVTHLQKSDFSVFKPQPRLETIVSIVRVHYNYDHSRDEWRGAEKINDRVQILTQTTQALDVFTFLRDTAAADILAQRYQLIAGAVSTEVEFALRRPLLVEHRAGDRVLVTYDRAPSVSGRYEARAFELVRLGKSFAPTVAVVGRLGDLRGIGSAVGRWTAADAPDYASATDDDRASSGFFTGDDDCIVPGDLATLNKSLWW